MASEELTPSSDRVPFFKDANRVVLKALVLAAVTVGVVLTFQSALQHAVIPGMNETLSSWSSLIGQLIWNTTVDRPSSNHTTPASSDALTQVPAPPDVLFCRTRECRNFGWSTVQQLQGSRIEPCHDFYGHVCSSWERQHPLNGHNRHLVSFDTVTMKRYVQIFKVALKSVDPRSNLGLVYSLCQKKTDTLFSKLVQTFLYTLGFENWPYTVHSAKGMSFEEVSYKVGSVYRELGLDSLFSFSVDEDETNR
ncbi:unnamed protein product, partial [Ixodes hexagonus]